ncbi:MAG: enoyl-CoA hydratase/isomerase family protein, partial [Planctomycetales bacterium]
MSEPLVKIDIQQSVAWLVLARPEKRNALSRAILAELKQAFHDLLIEKSVRTVILTGAGTVFCAGMDLKEMAATASMPDAHKQW